jgi:hypothetical protein
MEIMELVSGAARVVFCRDGSSLHGLCYIQNADRAHLHLDGSL